MMIGIVALFVGLSIYAIGYKNGFDTGFDAGEMKADSKYKDKIVVKTKEVVDED